MAQVFVLGAGTPTPTPHRFGSAFAVQVGGEYLMFDCGPAATHKLVKMGIFPTQVDYLFFTHHWKARVNHPLSQRVFVNRGGTLPRKPPHVLAKDVGPGPVHRGREWAVSAAPAEHVQPYLDSLAYRLDSTEGSIVFTGDTQPCRSVVDLARGADMMLCMCWDDQERMQANGEAPGQCGTTGAAQMAQEAGVKKLVLVHIGPHLSTHGPMEKGIGDVRRIYSGEIIFADELLALRV